MFAAAAMFSCQKENVEPNQTDEQANQGSCECGIIVSQSHHIDGTLRNVTVENYCSGNLTTHWPTQSEMTSKPHYIGAEWCSGWYEW